LWKKLPEELGNSERNLSSAEIGSESPKKKLEKKVPEEKRRFIRKGQIRAGQEKARKKRKEAKIEKNRKVLRDKEM